MSKNKRPSWTWYVPLIISVLSLLSLNIATLIGSLIGWFFGNISYDMMKDRNRNPVNGWFFGFFFGLIGAVLVAIYVKITGTKQIGGIANASIK